MSKEYKAGKIIRLDEETHKRLAEFVIPDETFPDAIKRLLDFVTIEAQRTK